MSSRCGRRWVIRWRVAALLAAGLMDVGVASAGADSWARVRGWQGSIRIKNTVQHRSESQLNTSREDKQSEAFIEAITLEPGNYLDSSLCDWTAQSSEGVLSSHEQLVERQWDPIAKTEHEQRVRADGAGKVPLELTIEVYPEQGEYVVHYFFYDLDVTVETEQLRNGYPTEKRREAGKFELPGWVRDKLPAAVAPLKGTQRIADGEAVVTTVEWHFDPVR